MLEFIRKCFQSDTKDMKKTNRRNRGLRIENCEERVLLTVSPLQADLPEVEQTSYSALDFSAEQGILEAVNINVENGSNLSNSLQTVSDEGGIITPMNAVVTVVDGLNTFNAGDTATIAGIEFEAGTDGGTITVDNAATPTEINITTGSFALSGTGTVAIDAGKTATIEGITFTAGTGGGTIIATTTGITITGSGTVAFDAGKTATIAGIEFTATEAG